MKINTTSNIEFGTSIKTVVVPDILRQRVKTGVKYLDGVFGGQGLTPSQVTLFTGMSGAGKTTMMLTLANGLAARGHEVVYNSNEESLFQVKIHAERLLLKHGFRLGEVSHVPTLLANCDKIRAQNPHKKFILIVDSLQTLNDGKYGFDTNSQTPVRCLEMITSWCKENNTMAIVIGQVGKSGEFAGKNVLKHMVDTMLQLTIDLKKLSPTYGLRVLKMTKNRFGGGASTYYLSVGKRGFTVAATEGDEENDNE